MPNQYIDKILRARVYDVAKETPLEYVSVLSKRCHNNIYLKREDLQPVFSFKLRGAYNKMVNLTPAEQKRGVIASSAGNHAQGVALSAQKLGLKALIVMPKTTPQIKVQAVKELGASVVLFGDTYDEAYEHALLLEKEKGAVFIHPYDDPMVIAGQGTIAMEILRQFPDPITAIFVPVGGGGLIAGIAAYVKYVRPEIKVIGVEPDDAACLHAALQAKQRVTLPRVGLFADGVAVKMVGAEPFRLAQKCVDEVILASTDEICAAIKDIFDSTRSVAEPAGALAVAGMKKYLKSTGATGQNFVAIDSGANVNFDRLRHISERAEIGEQKEALLAVTIPEKPGSFRAFCDILKKRPITEFNYRYSSPTIAHVFAGISLQNGRIEKEEIIADLQNGGYPVVDLTEEEVAKLHLRHMIGGKTSGITDERLFRCQFPERPGALLQFLKSMGSKWNISLFHYRNHGADFGRVLVGIQVPVSENASFLKSLHSTGYEYIEETANAGYQLFL